MTIEEVIRLFAGVLVLLSIIFGYYFSPYWYFLAVFVALNLIQSALTGFCFMEKIFLRFGKKTD